MKLTDAIHDGLSAMLGIALAAAAVPTDDPYPQIDDETWPEMREAVRAADPPTHPSGILVDENGEELASNRAWYPTLDDHRRRFADAGGEHVWQTYVTPLSEMLATEKASHETTINQWNLTLAELADCEQQRDVLIDEIEAIHDAHAAELADLEAQHTADMQVLNDQLADVQAELELQQQMTQQAIANYEACQQQLQCPGDLNGDGVIDGADVAILIGAWGPCEDDDGG